MTFREGASYEEPKLLEMVKSLRVDMDNCASVVAANSNRTKKQVLRAMLDRTTVHPEAALEWGLAHEIRQQLFERGSEVVSIQAGGWPVAPVKIATMFVYPNFDPIPIAIGPLQIRWYGLMYLLGFLAGWWLARHRAKQPGSTWTPAQVDDLIFYCAIGVIVGGRLGWMLFYGTNRLLAEPLDILRIWEGGMSFHGGLAGVMIALVFLARRYGKTIADTFDFTVPLPAIGLGAGRLGNFINGELWGKPTDVPWAFVVDGVARHPSQLYEALLEGLVLFAILWWYTAEPRPRLAPSGLFLVCYGVFRFAVEFVRVPDENRGYLAFGWLTTGQLLTLPMLIAGMWILLVAYRRDEPSGNYARA